MSNNSDPNDSCGRKAMRVFKDCIEDPVYTKPGFSAGLCRDYSPERPENLEPKKVHEVGTYAYSKLQLPSPNIKMSGANMGYTAQAPMSASGAGGGSAAATNTATKQQQTAPPTGGAQTQSPQSGGGNPPASNVGQEEERTNYGTFLKPDHKGKGKS